MTDCNGMMTLQPRRSGNEESLIRIQWLIIREGMQQSPQLQLIGLEWYYYRSTIALHQHRVELYNPSIRSMCEITILLRHRALAFVRSSAQSQVKALG